MTARILIFLLSAFLLSSCGPVPESDRAQANPEQVRENTSPRRLSVYGVCQKYGGRYSRIHRECDSTTICQGAAARASRACQDNFRLECGNAGGRFNQCVSPCRHQPDVRACIASCVAVCRG